MTTKTPSRRRVTPKPVEAVEPARTPQRILDSAEALFGEHSFDGVSMRDISARAGVNLGLVHYHFGSKEALFEQVVRRRATLLSDLRCQRLEALKAAGRLHVEDLMAAFIGPMFELMKDPDPGWPSYVRLLAHLGQSNRWLGLLDRYYDETARRFMAALQTALPEAAERDVIYGFNFALITMLHAVAQNRRLNSLSAGRLDADDLDASYEKLMIFVCGALRALAMPSRAGSG